MSARWPSHMSRIPCSSIRVCYFHDFLDALHFGLFHSLSCNKTDDWLIDWLFDWIDQSIYWWSVAMGISFLFTAEGLRWRHRPVLKDASITSPTRKQTAPAALSRWNSPSATASSWTHRKLGLTSPDREPTTRPGHDSHRSATLSVIQIHETTCGRHLRCKRRFSAR